MRLIDADALKASYVVASTTTNSLCHRYVSIEDINSAPTIDAVEVAYGEWIDKGWKGDWQFETDGRGNCWYEYECSECGFRNKGSKSNYCPNCGADMRGEDNE